MLAGFAGLRWGAILAGVQLLVGVSLGLVGVLALFAMSEPAIGTDALVSALGLIGVAVGLIVLAVMCVQPPRPDPEPQPTSGGNPSREGGTLQAAARC